MNYNIERGSHIGSKLVLRWVGYSDSKYGITEGNQEKNPRKNPQQTQPTYSTGPKVSLNHTAGWQALSPLCHSRSPSRRHWLKARGNRITIKKCGKTIDRGTYLDGVMDGVSFLVLRHHKREFVSAFGGIQFRQVKRTVNFCALQERVIWNVKKKLKRQTRYIQSRKFLCANFQWMNKAVFAKPQLRRYWALLIHRG